MTRADLAEQHTAVRGTTLAWSEEGDGPTVVWAHGLSNTRDGQEESGAHDWSPVAANHRLVRYDARGHGASAATAEPAAYEWPQLAGDLLALLDAVAPGERVIGMGSSMGTATLLHAAIQDPARFSKLVLTGPPTAWDTRAAQGAVYEQLATLVETDGLEALKELTASFGQLAVFADVTPDVGFGLTAESLPVAFRGAAKSDLPSPEAITGIDVPVLLLAWAQDPGHPVITSARLAEYLPDAVMRVAETPAELARWGGYAADFIAD